MIHHAIRRNTWLLFLAQVMLSSGLSSQSQLGSLIVFALTGTAALAGLPTAIFHAAMACVAYPAGRFMDLRGRRPGLVSGFIIGALGATFIAVTVNAGQFVPYLMAMVIYSVGGGIGMLTRGIAGDMYPTAHRGGAVGMVVAGGLLGGILGPSLVALGDRLARAIGANPLAVPWLFTCVMFAIAAVALSRLRPDPREIAARLSEYFPQTSSFAADLSTSEGVDAERASVGEILSSRQAQAAIVALACAQATMVMLMSTASLMLSLHGHGVTTISLVMMAHVTGMFALSVPVGRLADRVGRGPVMIGGALLGAASGMVFPFGIDSPLWAATSFFLVGLGWCMAFVAGAALLGDLSGASTRARVLGVNDLFTSLSGAVAALLGGLLLARGGEATVGFLAAALGALPLLAIARAGRMLATAPATAPADGGS